jgi:hypothetical protein
MGPVRDKIRAMCHELRMSSLSGVGYRNKKDIQSRIRALPVPERISAMSHKELQAMSVRIERLIFDIDNSIENRTAPNALRNMIDKGLPLSRPPILGGGKNWYKTAIDYGLEGRSDDGNIDEEGIDFNSDAACPYCGQIKPVPQRGNLKDPRTQCGNCKAFYDN